MRGERWRRRARLVGRATVYELRKAVEFRAGFVTREVLRGIERPLVMIAVFYAMFQAADQPAIEGFGFRDLVHYLLLVATLQKVVFHHRALQVAEQIFDGYITKYMVMPFDYFVLPLGRFLQHTAVQLLFALPFYLVGLLLVPQWWPRPAGALAAAQALVLVVLGSYCVFVVHFVISCLAFWLDVVWTLRMAAHFVIEFARGVLFPIAIMPPLLKTALMWLFPYWTLSAPIEIFTGRLGGDHFLRGLAILTLTAVLLEIVRRDVWRRGIRRYTGAGM